MILVKLRDLTGALPKEIKEIDVSGGVSIADLLMQEYPAGISTEFIKVALNHHEVKLPLFNSDGELVCAGDEELLTAALGDNDTVGFVETQKGDPISWAMFIIAIVASVVAYTMIPDIPQPNDPQGGGSTNNQYFGQENSARLYRAIPNMYGTQVSYPDLITSEAFKTYYDGDKSEIVQYMCLGYGQYEQLEGARLGGTLISDIPGASVEYYEPTNNGKALVPNFKAMFSVGQINGQEVLGPISRGGSNFSIQGFDVVLTPRAIAELASGPEVEIVRSGLGWNSQFIVGEQVCLINTKVKHSDEIFYIDGIGTVFYVDQDSIGLYPFYPKFPDDYYDVNPITESLPKNLVARRDSRLADSETNYIGPYDTTVPGQGVVLNLNAPKGLANSVLIRVDIQKIDKPGGVATGPVDNRSFFLTPNQTVGKYTPVSFTEIIDTSPSSKNNYFRVTISRDDLISQDPEYPDNIRLEGMASFFERDDVDLEFDGVTVMKVTIPGVPGSLSPRQNQVNQKVRRKTVTYDTMTQTIDETLSGSNRFADAVLHEFYKVFGNDPVQLDLDALYSIQESVDASNPLLGEFCYTFDDENMGLEQRIQAACNAARVQMYRDGSLIRFVRDERRQFVSGVITTRDLASNRNFSKSWRSRIPSEFDGIRIEYIDPDLNKKAYIYRTIDSNGNVTNTPGRNNKTEVLTGCRNAVQAENRADLNIRRSLYDFFTISDTLLSQGHLYDIGDVVVYADVYSKDVHSGEVIKIIDTQHIVTGEQIEVEAGIDYQVSYNDEYGDVYGPFDVDSIVNGNTIKTVDPNAFSFAYVSDYASTQLGSRFVLSRLDRGDEQLYQIREKKPNSNGTVDITMVNYDERVFPIE